MKTFFALMWFRKTMLLLLIFAFVFACNKPGDKTPEPVDESCGVENLITGLPWLKKIIENNSSYTIHEYAFIYSYLFKGKQVVYLWNSSSSKNPRIVFKCDGTELLSSTSAKADWEEFEVKKTEEILLWQKTPDPVDSICGVKNPLTDLPWLKDLINGKGAYNLHRGALIYAFDYKGIQVIYKWNRASSYSPEIVFNCDGTELIPYPSWPELEEFKNERTGEILLWEKE